MTHFRFGANSVHHNWMTIIITWKAEDCVAIFTSHDLGVSVRIVFFDLFYKSLELFGITSLPPNRWKCNFLFVKKFNIFLCTCIGLWSILITAVIGSIVLSKKVEIEKKIGKKMYRKIPYHHNHRVRWQFFKSLISPKVEIMGVHILMIICLGLKRKSSVMDKEMVFL